MHGNVRVHLQNFGFEFGLEKGLRVRALFNKRLLDVFHINKITQWFSL